MRIDIVTLFPEVFSPLYSSIPAKAQEMGALELHLHWLRKWGLGKQYIVDDTPFGGGPGMVLKPEPFFECFDEILETSAGRPLVIAPSPVGQPFDQKIANELALHEHLVFFCGHYEGIDERVVQHLVDRELSLGDYVVSSGELASMTMVDAIVRLLPGVIKEASYQQDSFYQGGLDHADYTKPASYRGLDVPPVLLSGHHEKIEQWRQESARQRTTSRRPDLVARQMGIENKVSSDDTTSEPRKGPLPQ